MSIGSYEPLCRFHHLFQGTSLEVCHEQTASETGDRGCGRQPLSSTLPSLRHSILRHPRARLPLAEEPPPAKKAGASRSAKGQPSELLAMT